MFALNQGEVCTCPSRALVHEKIYDKFMARAVERTQKVKQGHPLDSATMIGAQASNDQLEKILSYIKIGGRRRAVLTGGALGHERQIGGALCGPPYRGPIRCACSGGIWSRRVGEVQGR
jgi:aldehyde dehydrogenase